MTQQQKKQKESTEVKHSPTIASVIISKVDRRIGTRITLKNSERDIQVVPFKTDTASVSYSQKAKISLPNYESVEVFCSVSIPCYIETIEATRRFAVDYVSSWLEGEVEELRDSIQVANNNG